MFPFFQNFWCCKSCILPVQETNVNKVFFQNFGNKRNLDSDGKKSSIKLHSNERVNEKTDEETQIGHDNVNYETQKEVADLPTSTTKLAEAETLDQLTQRLAKMRLINSNLNAVWRETQNCY